MHPADVTILGDCLSRGWCRGKEKVDAVPVYEMEVSESVPYRLLVRGGGHRVVVTRLYLRGEQIRCHHVFVS